MDAVQEATDGLKKKRAVPKHPRVVVPAHLPKPGFSPMATPNRRVASISRIENSGWSRVPGDGDREVAALTVHFSDGAVHVHQVDPMQYTDGERQGIVERAITGKSTTHDLRRVKAIQDERSRKVQQAYGYIQSHYKP